MATLTTIVDGTAIIAAPINANFAALNTEIVAAQRTGFARYSAVGNIGTGEDILHSWTMPAGTLSAAGDGYVVHSRVVFLDNVNTKTLAFYASRSASGVGGSKIVLNPTTAAPNNQYADVTIHCVYDGAGNISGTATMLFGGPGAGTSGSLECVAKPVAGTHVPASARIVEFTGQGTTNNDVYQDITTIFIFKAAA